MDTKIEVKLTDSQGQELPAELQVKKLTFGLQQFLRLLVDEIFAQDMNALEAKNRASKAKKKNKKQAKGTTRHHLKKKEALENHGLL